MRVAQFVFWRVLTALLTLVWVAVLIFFSMRAIPGSFVDVVLVSIA